MAIGCGLWLWKNAGRSHVLSSCLQEGTSLGKAVSESICVSALISFICLACGRMKQIQCNFYAIFYKEGIWDYHKASQVMFLIIRLLNNDVMKIFCPVLINEGNKTEVETIMRKRFFFLSKWPLFFISMPAFLPVCGSVQHLPSTKNNLHPDIFFFTDHPLLGSFYYHILIFFGVTTCNPPWFHLPTPPSFSPSHVSEKI